jgi:hypothetical protein|tara:strand:- start:104 stop:346 length:243 start_codon:yes stop_codon:yes gene_type:complete
MIISKIAKAVLKLLLPDVTEHLLKIFKLDKMLNYMELPNEADMKIEKLEEKIKMMAEEAGEVKDIIAKLSNKSAFKKLFK